MLISDLARRITARIETDHSAGTGFFVDYEIEPGNHRIYIVTARHVITDYEKGDFLDAHIHINTDDGKSSSITVPATHWRQCGSDVAAAEWEDLQSHEGGSTRYRDIWNPNERWLVGGDLEIVPSLGDVLMSVGIFENYPGVGRIEPIVRMGSIALAPPVKVKVPICQNCDCMVDAFLAEVRSWGGASGSPVFLTVTADRFFQISGQLISVIGGGGPVKLIGLLSHHFDVFRPVGMKATGYGSSTQLEAQVNSGIAVVLSSAHIIEVLDHPDFVEARGRGL